MNKLLLGLSLFLITIICSSTDALAQSPLSKAIDYKVGDYVELKDGRQGFIESVVKVPAVGTPKLITYEIHIPVWVDSSSVVKKFDDPDAVEAVPPPPPEPANPNQHLIEAIQQLYNSLDQLSFRVSQLEAEKDFEVGEKVLFGDRVVTIKSISTIPAEYTITDGHGTVVCSKKELKRQ